MKDNRRKCVRDEQTQIRSIEEKKKHEKKEVMKVKREKEKRRGKEHERKG